VTGGGGTGATPPPPPPHAETLNASTTAHALDAKSCFVILVTPLKPLKLHGFPFRFMVTSTFQFA
jgi:hypothetical protein